MDFFGMHRKQIENNKFFKFKLWISKFKFQALKQNQTRRRLINGLHTSWNQRETFLDDEFFVFSFYYFSKEVII